MELRSTLRVWKTYNYTNMAHTTIHLSVPKWSYLFILYLWYFIIALSAHVTVQMDKSSTNRKGRPPYLCTVTTQLRCTGVSQWWSLNIMYPGFHAASIEHNAPNHDHLGLLTNLHFGLIYAWMTSKTNQTYLSRVVRTLFLNIRRQHKTSFSVIIPKMSKFWLWCIRSLKCKHEWYLPTGTHTWNLPSWPVWIM